jgi:hypothetical protein
MPSDFGDDSGEKLIDWMKEIIDEQGERALEASAKKLSNFFTKAREGVLANVSGADEAERWVRLNMQEIEDLPAYDTIKEIISDKLNNDAIKHEFAKVDGHDFLVFQAKDAPAVSEAFGSLEQSVSKGLKQTLSKEVEQIKSYREMPLAERARAARAAAAAYEASHDKTRERTRARVEEKAK